MSPFAGMTVRVRNAPNRPPVVTVEVPARGTEAVQGDPAVGMVAMPAARATVPVALIAVKDVMAERAWMPAARVMDSAREAHGTHAGDPAAMVARGQGDSIAPKAGGLAA